MGFFTEDEYERELELQHVEIPARKSASETYKKLPQEVKDNPRSGVFRDFVQYGVYPARVVVQYAVITIPFILKSLTEKQLSNEIIAQGGVVNNDKKKSPLENAYILIDAYKKNKNSAKYSGAMKRYLSALNLYFFRFGGFDGVCRDFLVPKRKDLIMLAPLIPEDFLRKELEEQFNDDPTQWQKDFKELRDPSREYEILLVESMTNRILTSNLRGIVEWFKKAYRRERLYELLGKITQDYKYLIPVVRLKALV